jgi:hypothetical protein
MYYLGFYMRTDLIPLFYVPTYKELEVDLGLFLSHWSLLIEPLT